MSRLGVCVGGRKAVARMGKWGKQRVGKALATRSVLQRNGGGVTATVMSRR